MSTSSPRLAQSFSRAARNALQWVILTAVVVFAVTGAMLTRQHAKSTVREQARLCGMMLELDDSIDAGQTAHLEPQIRKMVGLYSRLLGVAVTKYDGTIAGYFPQRESVWAASNLALLEKDGLSRVEVDMAGTRQDAWGVVVALDGEQGDRRAVLLFQRPSMLMSWLLPSLVLSLLSGGSAYLAYLFMRRWFERRISGPLETLAAGWDQNMTIDEWADRIEHGGWRETSLITEHLRELGREIIEIEDRARRLVQMSQIELEQREANYNIKLRRARDQATLDPLTRLRNRRFLDEELEAAFAAGRAKGTSLSLVMLDLDNFKSFNDTQGHQAGDDLLRFVGDLINGSIRPEDYGIRYGGDEFMLILPDTDLEQARAVADRMVKLFAQYTRTMSRTRVPVTMSAGVACNKSTKVEDGHALMKRADEVLYEAKTGGKNGVHCAA